MTHGNRTVILSASIGGGHVTAGRALEATFGSLGIAPFRAVYRDAYEDLIRIAPDLVVGKPGGLTTSEALAAALPFVVVDPYPLQEEANARFLLETGAGIRVDPSPSREAASE